jgi:DNA-binding transcriptional MerR regulator
VIGLGNKLIGLRNEKMQKSLDLELALKVIVIKMTIAEAGKRYGLSTYSLRYYEKIGLIPPITRSKSGIRDYSENDCGWVEFIKCMRSAGISVESLIEYVKLLKQGDSTRQKRKVILIEQRGLLEKRITELRETIEKLNFKIESYDTELLRFEKKLFDKEVVF